MSAAIFIPARRGSTRYPNKPLAQINGIPLIQHTVSAALKTGLKVFVATDCKKISEKAEAAGAATVMTGYCQNGTERCIEAALAVDHHGPIINWQGDSPLFEPELAIELLDHIDAGASVSTPVQLCDGAQAARIRMDAISGTAGATTVAMTDTLSARYFSKQPIPFKGPLWMHVGIYAISRAAISRYGKQRSALEECEGLEQLRWFENAVSIKCMPINGTPIWEVNVPADVAIVANLMERRNEFNG